MEKVAHAIVYEADVMKDYSLPADCLALITVPTLVIDGGTVPWMSSTAEKVAAVLPRAERATLAGQPHNVAAEAIAPLLARFFGG
jgi:hypothetical protein